MATATQVGSRLRFNLFDLSVTLFILVFAVICFYPMWYVFVVSITPYQDFIRKEFILLPPLNPTFQYYEGIIVGGHEIFLRAMTISITKTGLGAGAGMLITAMLAYGVSKRKIPGARLINYLMVFTLFFSGGLIPLYLLVVRLGMNGTYLALVLPSAFINTGYFIIMRNFFSYTVPPELEDAALIDGANEFSMFFRIIMPISKAMLAAIFLFLAVYHWNDYYSWLIFCREVLIMPFVMLLRQVLEQPTYFFYTASGQQFLEEAEEFIPPKALVMTTIVLTMVPIMMLYPFLQRHFARGILIGAIKE